VERVVVWTELVSQTADRGAVLLVRGGANGADRAGYGLGGNTGGRGRTGLTDTDQGGNADNAGNGRGATRNSASGLTDGDSGPAADRASYGRGPRRNW
jgi:hypothetical protein